MNAETASRWLAAVKTLLWPYFRPQVIGAENLPKGRALIVGCHSGVLPYDAACTLVAIHDATGRFSWAVGDYFFGQVEIIESFLRRNGAVVGKRELVERILRRNNYVLVFPGGAKDMERPYLTQRYRVLPHRGWAPGHGGFIKVALKTRSPIVPLAVVGAEEAHVMLGTVPVLDRVLRVPFFPLLLFPLPLPVKLYVRFGKPIELDGKPSDAADQRKVDRLTTMVRKKLQALIDDTLHHRHGLILSSYDEVGGGNEDSIAKTRSRRRANRRRT